jgi:hypothetical protein
MQIISRRVLGEVILFISNIHTHLVTQNCVISKLAGFYFHIHTNYTINYVYITGTNMHFSTCISYTTWQRDVKDTSVSTAQSSNFHGPVFDELVNGFSDLFSGKCTAMKNGLYKIQLEPDEKLIFSKPYMPALKRELHDLLASGVI